MPDKDYKRRVIEWVVNHPGGLWQDNAGAAAARKWLRANAPDDFRSLYYNESDGVRNSIDRRFLPDGVESERFRQDVSDAIDDFGGGMYDVVDTVTAFMPGPAGAVNWVGHMGADAMAGNWGKVGTDLSMAALMGLGIRGVGKLADGVRSLRNMGKIRFELPYESAPGHSGAAGGTSHMPKVSVAQSSLRTPDYGGIRFIRNIDGLPYGALDDGITLAPQTNIFGNFTTDVPFRLHPDYGSMPGGEILLVDPEGLRGRTPWSIEPMDTFFRSEELTGIDPKYITIISGDESILSGAEKLGMKTYTNQNLIDEYRKVTDYIDSNLRHPASAAGRINLGKTYVGWQGTGLDVTNGYRRQVEAALSEMGRPTAHDYGVLESATGLPSKTSGDVGRWLGELDDAMSTMEQRLPTARTMETWMEYPGGNRVGFVPFRKQMPYLKAQLPFYENVFYDPFPTVESDYLRFVGGTGHQQKSPKFEQPLEYMFNRYIQSKPLAEGGYLNVNTAITKEKNMKSMNDADRIRNLASRLSALGYTRDNLYDGGGLLAQYAWRLGYRPGVGVIAPPEEEDATSSGASVGQKQAAADGGLLRRLDDGGRKEASEVLPEVVVTPYGNYVNYTGDETTVPSIADFFDAKADAARVHAVGKMLNMEHPVVPAVPNALARNLLVRFGVSDDKAAGLLGYDKHPHTCIATTTAQYGDPEAFVPGNVTFDKNRTGFVQVGDYDYVPGDLVNLYDVGMPYHSTMVTGVVDSPLGEQFGSPVLTYSNGGIDVPEGEPHMRYSKDNLYDDGDAETPDFGVLPGNSGSNTYKVFRYVGSPSRKIDWGREYNSKYGYSVDEKGNAVEPRDKMYGLLSKMQQYGYEFERTADGKLKVVRKQR